MRSSILAATRLAPTLALAALLAGCEQPVRSVNPAPLEAAAEHFGVPVAVLAEMQATAARIQPPPQVGTGPNVSGAPVEELRRTLEQLELQVAVEPGAQP